MYPFVTSAKFLFIFPFRAPVCPSQLSVFFHNESSQRAQKALSLLSSSLLLSSLSAGLISNSSILYHVMLCPGIDFSACWASLDPTRGWCLVKDSPGILLGHLFNMKAVQKELAGDGFALNSNPIFCSKDNAGKDQHQCQGSC